MADKNQNLEAVEPVVEKKPSRFKNFITNHPRITAVFGFTAVIILITGVFSALKGKKSETVNSSSDTDLQDLVRLESTETA